MQIGSRESLIEWGYEKSDEVEVGEVRKGLGR
jgi:hypothetical protein